MTDIFGLPEPWPWYVAGPLIGLTVPLMLLLAGKNLGVSSSFRHLCAALLPKSGLAYLRGYDWRKESWNLFFAAGLVLGGFIATRFLSTRAVSPAASGNPHPAGRLAVAGGRIPHRLRHALRGGLHLGPQHHGPVQPAEGEPGGHAGLFRRWPHRRRPPHLAGPGRLIWAR